MRRFAAVVCCSLCIWASEAKDSLAEQGTGDFHRGMIEASEVLEVSSQVPGIIENVAVERGDRIQQGQVLATLKSDMEKAQVDLANARLEFGKRKVLRNEELYQKQLISIHEKDEMETEVHVMQIQLQDAQERLNLRTIKSPVNGVVVERHLGSGEYVGEGSIMKIARVDPLNVEVIVPSSLYGTITKGMKAEVRPENPIGGSHQGQVVIVDEVVDAASGTFGVRVHLPNPGHKLPAGINCQVRFFN
jgi:membrane fusion protein, multidrug efflux system